jgi:lysophospholipase L1-like esterase
VAERTDSAPPFAFTNLTGRGTGPVTRALGVVLPGVADVQRQVPIYAAAWREANQAALRGTRVRWVALGDSMTQGIGASAPTQGWIGQLARSLPVDVDVVNLSQSGARVEDVIATQLPVWRKLAPAPAGEIMTVLIGSNDVMSPRHRGLLPEAITELLELLPPGTIVSDLPTPVRPADQVNALVRDAETSGAIRAVHPVQLGPGAWRGKLAADRFHPNDAGYAMIAEVFAATVAEALDAIG